MRWLGYVLLWACLSAAKPSERFWELGASTGFPLPLALHGGLEYSRMALEVDWGYWHVRSSQWWTGTRVGFYGNLVRKPWRRVRLGLAGQYFYAQAPDGQAQAVNEAYGKQLLYPYRWEDWFAVGPSLSLRYFGAYTEIGVPIWQFRDVRHQMSWRLGFVF